MGYQFGKQGNNLKEYVGEFFFQTHALEFS